MNSAVIMCEKQEIACQCNTYKKLLPILGDIPSERIYG